MSGELPLNLQGGINPCYIFYIRLIDCVKRESFVSLYCKDQYEDYRECKLGKRHKSFRVWYANESKKLKILSFPRFDEVSDSFVDGPLPQTADSFFKDDQKLKEFFEIKKIVHEHHHEKERNLN